MDIHIVYCLLVLTVSCFSHFVLCHYPYQSNLNEFISKFSFSRVHDLYWFTLIIFCCCCCSAVVYSIYSAYFSMLVILCHNFSVFGLFSGISQVPKCEFIYMYVCVCYVWQEFQKERMVLYTYSISQISAREVESVGWVCMCACVCV